ncbi:MAG: phage tail protein, partial [Treponema brennaborense]|nr:phage tail protein [Treponema brennaborense]
MGDAMIPILYEASATDFLTFGIGALADCVSCEVTEERNGAFECKLKYPTSGALFAELKKERIIKAQPNDTLKPQAFRIYRITVPINGTVTVYAQHISYDLANVGVTPFSLSAVSPTQAIDTVLNNTAIPHNFTFQTDYLQAKDFKVETPKSVRACLGGSEGSLMNLWGGEFEWDNFKIIHHQGRGKDNGVTIEYGKNMTKLEHDTDISDIYTDLLPYAVNSTEDGEDEVVTLPEVILPINTTLATRKTAIRDFTDSFEDGDYITADMLREKAKAYIENNPLGVETPSITISFEPLWKQPEYAAILECVSLCDTVTVKHSPLGITARTKVIKTVYDTLAEKYTAITLGSCKSNLADTVQSITDDIKSTKKAVDRFPAFMKYAIDSASKLITGQSGGYVVLHGDATGEPYELLILDAPNIEDAVNVWRWNIGGLGFSKNGYNGTYETAITADGAIVADFITTGSLVANIIKAGVLSSLDGSSYWNLETGEVVLKAYATTET